jgi:uncharacterized protein YecE (DUF72 family)
MVRIGTAGWAIRSELAACFPVPGSHLARYAAELNAVEINSSFYRPHRPATYTRWARETPDGFRFSVKMPRAITHEARLNGVGGALAEFFGQCGALGDKLGCVLIQLPPSFVFTQTEFFDRLRELYHGPAALEPRHPSWFTPEVETLLEHYRIARVAADPPLGSFAPGGWRGFEYWRLHGSPKTYYSSYGDDFLCALDKRLGNDAWVIFDNTALGHATRNALSLRDRMRDRQARGSRSCSAETRAARASGSRAKAP